MELGGHHRRVAGASSINVGDFSMNEEPVSRRRNFSRPEGFKQAR